MTTDRDLPKLEPLADGTGFRVRVRFGTKQQRRFRVLITDRAAAMTRAAALVELGATISRAKIEAELGARLLTMAGAGDSRELARVQAGVAKLAAGASRRVRKLEDNPRERWTFRDLGDAWTTGKLAAEYPDHVVRKRTSDKDAQRLTRLYKSIGSVRIREFSLAHAELAMRELPRDLSSASRRHYAQVIARLLRLAAYPLRLIPVSPLPRGFLPAVRSSRATAWLYPSEDAALMACPDVPLARRMLYGFLAREGCRAGEALALRWGDLDLERGAVRLDRNKTDDPRAWALAPGVAAALSAWRPRDARPSDLVFSGLDGEHMADTFRTDLEEAQIDRAELFERSKTRQPIRLHDLRATFVTLSLAAGRSEAWVSDRTGHRSSVMINRYRRAARTAAELDLGELSPLNLAIPELAPRRGRRRAAG